MKYLACFFCVIVCVTACSFSFADGYDGCTDMSFEQSDEVNPNVMYVSGQPYVRLRQTDSAELPYVAKMPYGSEVTVISTRYNAHDEEWSLVEYNGQFGFCKTEYLSHELERYASEMCPQTLEEAFGSTVLQNGNSAPDYRVKNLQLCLMEAGFLFDEKGADGYFGKNTYKALCDFQKAQHLDAVGRAGNITKTRLWYMYSDFLMENGVMQ